MRALPVHAQAIARFFLSHHESIVIAGTHGKSTTSSLLAWVLTHAGMSPSAFIGAFVKKLAGQLSTWNRPLHGH